MNLFSLISSKTTSKINMISVLALIFPLVMFAPANAESGSGELNGPIVYIGDRSSNSKTNLIRKSGDLNGPASPRGVDGPIVFVGSGSSSSRSSVLFPKTNTLLGPKIVLGQSAPASDVLVLQNGGGAIVGPAGPQGEQGPAGPAGPSGPQGPTGEANGLGSVSPLSPCGP